MKEIAMAVGQQWGRGMPEEKPMQVREAPLIPELDIMEKNLSAMREELTALTQRLSLLLTPCEEGVSPDAPMPTSSPVMDRLREFNRQIGQLRERIELLRDHLDL